MNVGIQNLLSDRPFPRSSQDWIGFVATAQNKDGGKTLLSSHGSNKGGNSVAFSRRGSLEQLRPRILV
ncbi:hypothetical protein OIU79_001375, partial [Salix purpurea]